MRPLLFFSLLLCVGGSMIGAEPGLKRYLYVSSPDAAQSEGKSGTGLLVFDMDQGHRFVRRISITNFQEGLRGLCGNVKNRAIYYTTTNRRLGAFDLEKEHVTWEKTYKWGCDRACITPDGTKLYVPTGWWLRGPDAGFLIVDPADGTLLRHLPVYHQAHNSIASLDGRFIYLGTETNLTVLNPADDTRIRQISGVGESGVFPFTINSRNSRAFVCLGSHVGFDVVDLVEGRLLHRVYAGQQPIRHRTHGAGLTPDEKELWISDQDGRRLYIFDLRSMPPQPAGDVELSMGGHGWVTFSMDGRHAYCHTPDVFDIVSRKVVATLKDESGMPVASSKFIEIHFRDGKVVAMGDQFGLGRLPSGQ